MAGSRRWAAVSGSEGLGGYGVAELLGAGFYLREGVGAGLGEKGRGRRPERSRGCSPEPGARVNSERCGLVFFSRKLASSSQNVLKADAVP